MSSRDNKQEINSQDILAAPNESAYETYQTLGTDENFKKVMRIAPEAGWRQIKSTGRRFLFGVLPLSFVSSLPISIGFRIVADGITSPAIQTAVVGIGTSIGILTVGLASYYVTGLARTWRSFRAIYKASDIIHKYRLDPSDGNVPLNVREAILQLKKEVETFPDLVGDADLWGKKLSAMGIQTDFFPSDTNQTKKKKTRTTETRAKGKPSHIKRTSSGMPIWPDSFVEQISVTEAAILENDHLAMHLASMYLLRDIGNPLNLPLVCVILEKLEQEPAYLMRAANIASLIVSRALIAPQGEYVDEARSKAVKMLMHTIPALMEQVTLSDAGVKEIAGFGQSMLQGASALPDLYDEACQIFFRYADRFATVDPEEMQKALHKIYGSASLSGGDLTDLQQEALKKAIDYLEKDARCLSPLDVMDYASDIRHKADNFISMYIDNAPPGPIGERACLLSLRYAQASLNLNAEKTIHFVEGVVRHLKNSRHFEEAEALLVTLRQNKEAGSFAPQTPEGALSEFRMRHKPWAFDS